MGILIDEEFSGVEVCFLILIFPFIARAFYSSCFRLFFFVRTCWPFLLWDVSEGDADGFRSCELIEPFKIMNSAIFSSLILRLHLLDLYIYTYLFFPFFFSHRFRGILAL